MGRNSSSPPAILDDNGGTDLGFHSIRDRFPFKRNPNPIHQRDRPRGLFTDRQPFPRPPPRSHHRFYRKGLLCLFPFKGKSAFYAVLIFALFVFAVATMLLQSSMTLVFRQGSERGRLLREGLKFGSTLRFMPGRVSKRVVEGDGLDRARNEARIGVRPPRLALILGNMKKDPQSLMLITVMKNIKKLGYKLKYRCWILNNYSTLGSGPHIDLLAGAAAGGTSVLCTYPLDLARTKLAYQVVNTRGNINCGMKGTHHQIVYKGIRDVLSSVYKEGGFRGLYRGVDSMKIVVGTWALELGFSDILYVDLIFRCWKM